MEEESCGFEWGVARIERLFSDDKKGWITLGITTPKHPRAVQIYVTKTGKVRIHDARGEWTPPERKSKQ